MPPSAIDFVGPLIGAVVFVLGMSFVPEPTRRTFNAILVAGSCGVYLSGGFGRWELLYPVVATPIIFRGLRSHRYIGVAWLLHAAWDLLHHLWGNPIWPYMATSSFGCFVINVLIAIRGSLFTDPILCNGSGRLQARWNASSATSAGCSMRRMAPCFPPTTTH
jgi:hypothetical protein